MAASLALEISNQQKNPRFGFCCAIAAQVLWGCFPIYVWLLKPYVDSVDFVAHRAVWSFVCLIGAAAFYPFFPRPWMPNKSALAHAISVPKILGLAAVAAVLIATNWLTFVWSVTNDHAIDASLGYYICPQVVVLLGVFVLKERLTVAQWIAIALATFGVGYMTQSSIGKPWIAIAIAMSFGLYALAKKKTKSNALTGLTLETGTLLLPAIIYLGWRWMAVEGNVFGNPWWVNLMLLGSGAATIAPLALYATALKHIPMSTIGVLQFLGPTIQFVIGVFVFGESFDSIRIVGFIFVWLGILVFMFALRAKPKEPSG